MPILLPPANFHVSLALQHWIPFAEKKFCWVFDCLVCCSILVAKKGGEPSNKLRKPEEFVEANSDDDDDEDVSVIWLVSHMGNNRQHRGNRISSVMAFWWQPLCLVLVSPNTSLLVGWRLRRERWRWRIIRRRRWFGITRWWWWWRWLRRGGRRGGQAAKEGKYRAVSFCLWLQQGRKSDFSCWK